MMNYCFYGAPKRFHIGKTRMIRRAEKTGYSHTKKVTALVFRGKIKMD